MNADDYITAYLEHLKKAGHAERTIETYDYNVRRFFRFMERHYSRVSRIDRITPEIVADYHNSLSDGSVRNGKPLSSATIASRLIALKCFFAYLVDQDLLLKNPARRVVIPKENRSFLRNVLTENEVRDILSGLEGTDPISRRDRAIVELLYACGIRTTELCKLRFEDIDLKDQTVTIVHAKGGKSRIVPIGQYASYYIGEYLHHARKYFLRYTYTDPGTLFLSRRGNPFNNSSINKAVMPKVERLLGAKRYVSCYSMRRAAATHLLEAEVDITYIAKLLGHSSLKSTQRYAQVNIGQLKKMHAKYHPRERQR